MTSFPTSTASLASMQLGYLRGANALRLAATIHGADSGPTVLLLPGAGQTRHAWWRTAQRLANRGYRAIALDLRGHGDSAWATDDDYSIGAFVADLSTVLSGLDKSALIVGASLGGIAALLAAASDTQGRVGGLALVDVVPDMRPEGLDHIREFMRSGMHGFASVAEAAAAVERFLPNRPARSSQAGLERNLRQRADGRLYWHWDPAFHEASAARAAEDMLGQMERAAPRVAVPTLLVTGEHSEVVDAVGARKLARLIPGAEWLSIAGARHMVAGDRNDPFGDALENFAARHLPV